MSLGRGAISKPLKAFGSGETLKVTCIVLNIVLYDDRGFKILIIASVFG